MPPLLILQDIHLTFGGTPALDGAELAVEAGRRLALVGRNGSGKSTLLKIAAGLLEPDRGERVLQQRTTVRYLPQEPDLAGFATVAAYVEAGLTEGDDAHRARYLIECLGLDPATSPVTLSGGELRRAALARALAPEPDVLLLDEPTNHLDLPTIEWLEEELRASRSAIVLISHDRRFLETLSDVTIWLDRGQTRRLEQGFAAFEAWRDDLLEQEERDRHKLDRKIVAELDWVTHGVSGRRKRNQRRLRELDDLRRKRRETRRIEGQVTMTATEAELSGKLVIEARGLTKRFGERAIVRDLDLRVLRGDRLALIGPNGAGKTTLVNLLTGVMEPDAGQVRLGANLQAVTLDQRRMTLDPDRGLTETLTDGRGEHVTVAGQRKHVMTYLADFLFKPEQARTPVGRLSGGERGRLALALALARPSNLLVLDEPTNDLDLETLELLQELLADHPGTVILVSHDRDFIDRVASSVLVGEGDGRWIEYAGGYTDMLAQKGSAPSRAGAAQKTPAPQRTRSLTSPQPTPSAQSTPPAPEGASQKRRMSFKDKHRLETLPAEIDALQSRIAALRSDLADADLYRRDPNRFERLSDELAKAETTLAIAEEDWLRLEMLREEIETRT